MPLHDTFEEKALVLQYYISLNCLSRTFHQFNRRIFLLIEYFKFFIVNKQSVFLSSSLYRQ